MREQFPITEEDGKYVGDGQPKIEMVSCPLQKELCVDHLIVINKFYDESNIFHITKDYPKSIEALKLAYNSTYEINNSSCLKCADLFRSIIISTLEKIHSELEGMTSGLFKSKRFQPSLVLAALVLEELRNKK